jgi:hypothetical protein
VRPARMRIAAGMTTRPALSIAVFMPSVWYTDARSVGNAKLRLRGMRIGSTIRMGARVSSILQGAWTLGALVERRNPRSERGKKKRRGGGRSGEH